MQIILLTKTANLTNFHIKEAKLFPHGVGITTPRTDYHAETAAMQQMNNYSGFLRK